MILKSVLRKVIDEVLEDHEVEDGNLAVDLLDRITDEVEVFDDEDEDGASPRLLGDD